MLFALPLPQVTAPSFLLPSGSMGVFTPVYEGLIHWYTSSDTHIDASHSGGLYSGSSADPSLNLTNFVRQSVLSDNPVVAVSLNYRLTAFGFLRGSREISQTGSSNNGLRDQRLALQWITENIGSFGGDPGKVTIWGESSGARQLPFQPQRHHHVYNAHG